MTDAARADERPRIRDYEPLPVGRRQYPLAYMQRWSVVKLREDERRAIVGVGARPTARLRAVLESFHRKRVDFVRVDTSELSACLGRLELAQSSNQGDDAKEPNRFLLDGLAHEAPLVTYLNGLLVEAVRAGASDIHLEGGGGSGRVRLRIDGALSTLEHFDARLFPAVSARIKFMANLNIMERRFPQDGRLSAELEGRSYDLRVSTVPAYEGESIVIRLFPAETTAFSIAELGLRDCDLALLQRAVQRPAGLLLVTGPTGSGKSTTLNALLRLLANSERKLISIEDPVEQLVAGVVQIQVNDRIGLTFDRLLRHVLRQDPNVVMVGEVRDSATAELAVRAGLTGHLIMTTMHTGGAVSAVARLRNLGCPAYLIAEVLAGSVAQRLVRRLCPHCKRECDPDPSMRRLFEAEGVRLERLFTAAGCRYCRRSGYAGRLPLFEAFLPDETTRDMIARGSSSSALIAREKSLGMTGLYVDGLSRVAEGLTTIEEVAAVVEHA